MKDEHGNSLASGPYRIEDIKVESYTANTPAQQQRVAESCGQCECCTAWRETSVALLDSIIKEAGDAWDGNEVLTVRKLKQQVEQLVGDVQACADDYTNAHHEIERLTSLLNEVQRDQDGRQAPPQSRRQK